MGKIGSFKKESFLLEVENLNALDEIAEEHSADEVLVYADDINDPEELIRTDDEAVEKTVNMGDGGNIEKYANEAEDQLDKTMDVLGESNGVDSEDEFYADAEDADDSEKVGLLLESVAKKMCNISHNVSQNDDEDLQNGNDADIDEDDDGAKCADDLRRTALNRGSRYRDQRKSSPSGRRPLLPGRPSSGEDTVEQPKNIEC